MKSGKHNTDLLSSEPRNLLCLSPRFSAWRHGKQPVLIYPPTLLSQRGSSFRRSHLKLPVSPPLWALHTVETKINATGDKMLSDLGEKKSELKTRQSHVYMHVTTFRTGFFSDSQKILIKWNLPKQLCVFTNTKFRVLLSIAPVIEEGSFLCSSLRFLLYVCFFF